MSLNKVVIAALSIFFLIGCASSAMKNRKDQQAKISQSSKLYCQFVNGDEFPDIDVAVNLEMAKKCDSDKPYTMTQYKTKSESNGIMFCCGTAAIASAPVTPAPGKPAPPKVSEKATSKTPDKPTDSKTEDGLE